MPNGFYGQIFCENCDPSMQKISDKMFMKIIKINENYIIAKADNFKIYVEKNLEKGTLTIKNKKGKSDFNFIDSLPENVKEIAEMFLEAAKL